MRGIGQGVRRPPNRAKTRPLVGHIDLSDVVALLARCPRIALHNAPRRQVDMDHEMGHSQRGLVLSVAGVAPQQSFRLHPGQSVLQGLSGRTGVQPQF